MQLVPDEAEADLNKWLCVYNTCGPCALKLYSKGIHKDVVQSTLAQLKLVPKEFDCSYIHTISRLIDFIHQTHSLQSNILSYPLYSNQLLKRKLVSLGYDTLSPPEDPTFTIDNKTAIEIIRQLDKRLEKDTRAYFEFTVSANANWRIGYIVAGKFLSFEYEKYPGQDLFGFGFDHTGAIHVGGKEFKYILYFIIDMLICCH
jgi:hypothetical protein